MIVLGAATSITTFEELNNWFAPLRDNCDHLTAVSAISKEYTAKNQGATEAFYNKAFL